MTCEQVDRLLSAFVDRELSGQQMLAVRDHVSRCPECAAELESIRSLRFALGAMVPVEPRPGLEDRLKEAVFSRRQPKLLVRRLRPAYGFAALSLGIVAMVWVLSAQNPPVKQVMEQDIEAFRAVADSTYVVGSDPFGSHVAVHPAGYADR
jgi:anti-sigma factor RsiW